MLPLLILQVIQWAGKLLPVKVLITYISKCPYCHEMRGYDETQADEDTEELTADQFNELATSGVPVMQQLIEPPGEPDKEEDEERPSRRKIGFRVDNEED